MNESNNNKAKKVLYSAKHSGFLKDILCYHLTCRREWLATICACSSDERFLGASGAKIINSLIEDGLISSFLPYPYVSSQSASDKEQLANEIMDYFDNFFDSQNINLENDFDEIYSFVDVSDDFACYLSLKQIKHYKPEAEKNCFNGIRPKHLNFLKESPWQMLMEENGVWSGYSESCIPLLNRASSNKFPENKLVDYIDERCSIDNISSDDWNILCKAYNSDEIINSIASLENEKMLVFLQSGNWISVAVRENELIKKNFNSYDKNTSLLMQLSLDYHAPDTDATMIYKPHPTNKINKKINEGIFIPRLLDVGFFEKIIKMKGLTFNYLFSFATSAFSKFGKEICGEIISLPREFVYGVHICNQLFVIFSMISTVLNKNIVYMTAFKEPKLAVYIAYFAKTIFGIEVKFIQISEINNACDVILWLDFYSQLSEKFLEIFKSIKTGTVFIPQIDNTAIPDSLHRAGLNVLHLKRLIKKTPLDELSLVANGYDIFNIITNDNKSYGRLRDFNTEKLLKYSKCKIATMPTNENAQAAWRLREQVKWLEHENILLRKRVDEIEHQIIQLTKKISPKE